MELHEMPILKEEVKRLQQMYLKAKADQLGVTMGLLDINAELQLVYKDRGMKVPPEIEEFFKP